MRAIFARFAAGEGTFSSLTASGTGAAGAAGRALAARGREPVWTPTDANTSLCRLALLPSVDCSSSHRFTSLADASSLKPAPPFAMARATTIPSDETRDVNVSVGPDTDGSRGGADAACTRAKTNAREREGCSRGRRARVALVRIGVCARGGGVLCGPQLSPQGKTGVTARVVS